MHMLQRSLIVIAGGALVLSSSVAMAQSNVVINTRQFTISQPSLPAQRVLEFNTLDSARTFYDFRSASSHMGIEAVGKSWFLLHRDSRPMQGEVAMIVTHGIDRSTSGLRQPTAQVNMDFTGLPPSVSVELSDDGGELTKPTATTARGVWRFADNTDGGVLGTFPPDQDWTVVLTPTFQQGITDWSVYTPSGEVVLDRSEALTIVYEAPPANAGFDLQSAEGSPLEICSQIFSANNATSTYTWTINDNPVVTVNGTTTTSNETVCVTHTFNQEGLYAVSLTADDGTGVGTATINVQVNNVAPTVDAGGPYVGDEGSTVTFTAQATDPGADTLEYRWDFDNDGTFDTMFSTSNTVDTVFAQNGSGTVVVEVSDGTTTTTASATYTIDNVGPTISSMPVTSVNEGDTYSYQVTVDDPGSQDVITYSVIAGPAGMAFVGDTLTWATTSNDVGDVAVEIEVCDDAGACTRQTFTVSVLDITAPSISLSTPTNNDVTQDTTPTVSGSTNDVTATVEVVVLDAQNMVVFTQSLTPDAQGDWSVDTSALPDGVYTVSATSTDPANNSSMPATATFTVDTTAPGLTLDTPANNASSNDQTLPIGGTSDAAQDVVVVVLDSNGQVAFTDTVSTDAQGNWNVETSSLPEGQYTINATTTDAAGNVASAGPVVVTIDVTAPGVTLDAPVDGATTSATQPAATGTSEADASITVTIVDAQGNTVETLTASADNAGQWSATPAMMLADGAYTYTVSARDAAGNVSTDGPSTITIDTTAPGVSITSPQDGSFTAQTRPAINGSSEAGASVVVEVLDDQNNVVFTQTVTADAQGNWQVTPSSDLTDGPYTINAQATDAAGNISQDTSGFTVDTTALAVAVTAPATGSTTAQDQPDVTGTTEANQAVTITLTDANGAVVETLMTTADAQGAWSVTPSSALTDGQYTATATVINQAGTQSSAATTFTVDTVAPTLTLNTPTDGSQTNDNTPAVSGVGEPGQSVNVVVKDANGQTVFADIVQVDAQGNWSIDTSPLGDATYTAEAASIDAAGNVSTVGPATFTVDTTAPAIAISAPAPNDIIAVRDVDVTGTTEPNSVVVVELLDGQGNVFETQTVTADAQGAFTASFSGLNNDLYTAEAATTDAAGNASSATTNFQVDSTDALVRIITPQDNSATNDAAVAISGESDADASVVVVIKDEQGVEIESITVTPDANGQWSATPTQPLADGSYSIEATATRPNGKTATDTAAVTVDTMPPGLTLDAPTDGEVIGDDPLVVNGTSEPGQVIKVVITDAAGNEVFTADVTTDDQGNWTATPPALADGTYDVTASTSDEAGNEATSTSSVTIDKTPAVITITSPTADETLDTDTPTVSGTVDEPGAVVEVFVDGQKVGETTADDQGNFSFDLPDALAEGMHTIDVKTTDAAGNEGSASVTVTVPMPKEPITITSPGSGATVDGPDVTITGTGEPGDEITVTVNGNDQTVTVNDDGTWTVTVMDVPEGDATITATSGDESVTVDVIVATPVDNTELVLFGGGCSATPGAPSMPGSLLLTMLLLGVVGLIRRKR